MKPSLNRIIDLIKKSFETYKDEFDINDRFHLAITWHLDELAAKPQYACPICHKICDELDRYPQYINTNEEIKYYYLNKNYELEIKFVEQKACDECINIRLEDIKKWPRRDDETGGWHRTSEYKYKEQEDKK